MATIIIKNSATPSSTPATLQQGEFAINIADGRLFYGSGSAGAVKEFTASGSGGSGTPGGSNTQVQYNNAGSFGGSANFTYTPSPSTLQLSGSFIVTGSTTQIGNNNLFGSTTLSGSITISGSTTTPATPTIKVYGDMETNGVIKFTPVVKNIDTSISGSYIYVSGSTNDLYFSQNGAGYNNVTRLRWLEGNLYTGLLHGGLIESSSSTVYTISSGSGIIVNLNSSYNDDPYPTVQYLSWGILSASIAPLSASFDQQFVAINSSSQIVAQGIPFNDGQFNTLIPIGLVLHQNHSTINGVKTSPSVAYGWKQRSSDFIRAFGPLKISGYAVLPSGSATGSLTVGNGTAFVDGANYAVDPNNPSYTVDNGTTTSKIFKYYQSGSDWVYNTNNGAGYQSLDPVYYNPGGLGALATVGTGNYSLQRVFWYPNSVTKAIVVYYGNERYGTLALAQAGLASEIFNEAPNTAANAVYLGTFAIKGGTNTTLQNPAHFVWMPGGLFRGGSSGGSGGGGTTPGGSNTQIQYNNNGAFGGVSDLTYDGTTLIATGSFSGSFTGTLNGTASNLTGGAVNYVPLWTSSTTQSTSSLYQAAPNQVIIGGTGSVHPGNEEALAIYQGVTTSYNLISGHSDIDSYSQLNIKNFNTGSNASSDIVATANNGTESENFIDIGINGSEYTNAGLVGESNDAYLYSTGQNLLIGNASTGKKVVIFNGGTNAAANAKLFIHDTNTGVIGINTDTIGDANNPAALRILPPNNNTYNLIETEANLDGFVQSTFTNLSSGLSASSDIVAYNDVDPINKTDGFIDMGITSTGYNDPTNFPGWTANTSYVYTTAKMLVGTVNNTGSIDFFVGGINPQTNRKLRLNYTNQHELSGSLNVSGSVTAQSFTGSLLGTAATASYLNTLNQNLTFNGNLTLNGTASITYLNVQYETASIIYSSGSNQFGDAANDTQTLYGTVIIPTGSLILSGALAISSSQNSYIVGSGNVGIGTTTPTKRLEIFDSTAGDGLSVVRNGVSVQRIELIPNDSTVSALIKGGGNNKPFYIASWANGGTAQPLYFGTNYSSGTNEVRMTIDATGSVGMGTLTPAARLHVSASTTDAAYSFLVQNSSGQVLFSAQNDRTVNINSTNQANGNTTIGTTNGTVVINQGYNNQFRGNSINFYAGGDASTIQGFTSNPGIAVGYAQTNTNPNSGSVFTVKGTATTSGSGVLFVTGSSNTRLLTVASEAISNILTVSGSGVVGIGASSLTYGSTGTTAGKLTISNTSGNNGLAIRNGDGGYQLAIKTTTNDAIGTEFVWYDGSTATFLQYGGSIGARLGASTISQFRSNNADSSATIHTGTSTLERFRVTSTGLVGIGTSTPSASLHVAGTTRLSGSFNTAISGSILTVIGSGSTQPIFTVQGSQGELFSVTDSLSGSLFSVNDISGLPILEVFSDNTTLIGDYLDPMLITTKKVTMTNSGSFVVYSLPTASYDTAFFDYSIKSGSNARAGQIMAIQSGTSVNFTETTTTDFGNTSAVAFTVQVSGSNMILSGSATAGSWTIKSIIRGI